MYCCVPHSLFCAIIIVIIITLHNNNNVECVLGVVSACRKNSLELSFYRPVKIVTSFVKPSQ